MDNQKATKILTDSLINIEQINTSLLRHVENLISIRVLTNQYYI